MRRIATIQEDTPDSQHTPRWCVHELIMEVLFTPFAESGRMYTASMQRRERAPKDCELAYVFSKIFLFRLVHVVREHSAVGVAANLCHSCRLFRLARAACSGEDRHGVVLLRLWMEFEVESVLWLRSTPVKKWDLLCG